MIEIPDNIQQTRPRGLKIPFGKRGLLILTLISVGTGAAMNWGWLTAIGLAPLILALAPCVVMCGLGLCMMRGSSACSNKNDPSKNTDV